MATATETSHESYTAELASEQQRHHQRTTIQFSLVNLSPKLKSTPQLIHNALGYLSAVTGAYIAGFMILGYMSLMPSIAFSKYVMGWPSLFNRRPLTADSSGKKEDSGDGSGSAKQEKNASTTGAGSTTALKTLSARSQMYLQGSGGPDHLAPLLMNQLSLLGPNIPGSYWFSQIYLALCRWNFYLTGRVFIDQLTEHYFGSWMSFAETALLQTRTCWLDDVVESFTRKHVHGNNAGTDVNVVILGAGYDTRCYRLQPLIQDIKSTHKKQTVHLFEVDAPGTQASKKKALLGAKIDCSHVNFVSCDFEREDWMDALTSQSNFDATFPTLFVWEGVSYYLDREVVVSTIAKVSSRCGKGSCIGFDYSDAKCFNPTVIKSTSSVGEPWKFGMDEQDVEGLVRDCNDAATTLCDEKQQPSPAKLEILDHLRCEEMKKRFLVEYVNGRHIGYLDDFGGYLLVGTHV